MFLHQHPYEPFIPANTTKLIVGTLPPPRFSGGDLLEKDVDFCYGSYYNSLWLYIDKLHELGLRYDNSIEAVEERKQFLIAHHIGICDIVERCEREKIDASDLGMLNIELRDLMSYLIKFPKIDTLIFTGGNSKNGPEYFFRRHLKEHQLKLEIVSSEVPRIHELRIKNKKGQSSINEVIEDRIIHTVSLTSASGSANRAIGSMAIYQQLKNRDSNFNTFDFRVMQYREFL